MIPDESILSIAEAQWQIFLNSKPNFVKDISQVIENKSPQHLVNKIAETNSFVKSIDIKSEFDEKFWLKVFQNGLTIHPNMTVELNFDQERKIFKDHSSFKKYLSTITDQLVVKVEGALTKVYTKFIVTNILGNVNLLPYKEQLDFIQSSISIIRKESVLSNYMSDTLNKELKFYHQNLEIVLDELKLTQFEVSLIDHIRADSKFLQLLGSLNNCDLIEFEKALRSIFASIPYSHDPKNESAYHVLMHVILFLLSTSTTSEEQTNQGRIDSVIMIGNWIYIFEYKLKTAQEAIDQIHTRKYYEKYQPTSKEIMLIGIAFDVTQRNIGEMKFEQLEKCP